MELSEGADDQGSGWLQVKKKHRNSSKFSLHGWVGGLSGKQGSRNLHTPPLPDVKNEKNNTPGGQLLKSSLDTVVHEKGSVAGATSVVQKNNEDEKNVHSRDICVVTLDNECPRSPVSTSVNIVALNHKPDQERTKNSGVHFKIKWGDLDDEILNMHHENSLGAERSTSHTEEYELTHRKDTDSGDSLSNVPATGSEENKLIAVVSEDHVPLESHSLPSMAEFVKENSRDVNEVFPEDVKSQITNEDVGNRDDAVASSQEQFEFTETDHDGNCNFSGQIIPTVEFEESVLKVDNDNNCIISAEKIICTANEEASMIQSRRPVVAYESSCSKVSGTPISDGESSKVLSRGQVLRPIDESGPYSPGAYEGIDSGEAFNVHQDAVLDDLSESRNVDAVDADGKGGGKERFRERLWCFLFENLNRALDELYLLCELECDLEQVTEAILVLEEAASDFRELNSRVEEFEKVKKSSSHSSGGAALTMQSDHRRPHALSWEVRRMTTSPHRAEILSSSLEVFRKIQEERARLHANDTELLGSNCHSQLCKDKNSLEVQIEQTEAITIVKESTEKPKKQSRVSDSSHGRLGKEKRTTDLGKLASNISRFPMKESSAAFPSGKSKKDLLGASSESGKLLPHRDKIVTENVSGRKPKSVDYLKRQTPSEREKEKMNGNLWKSMDAWKEKRNWEDILASTHGASSRFSHSPGISRRSAERARILHVKLMSPDKRKKSGLDLKREAEEKHARAMRIRSELENERLQKLQRASEKLNRVNEWQAVRSMKMREVIFDRQRRSESRHEAFLAQVVRRAGDESSKVNEVRFITSLNEENKKLILRQKLQDSQLRRAEKLQMLKTKQKEDMAREEAVLERKRLIEAEKLQRLAETQRKKEEAQLRREEERKASTAAREAKAIEQMRRKEVRAKAQQEEAELLAQKLAERLRESEQRRKFYLEQIRERASMDFRDQSSPLVRRSVNKDGQGRSTPNSNFDDFQANNSICPGGTSIPNTGELEHILKRRIKKIRQRLMALKYEFVESSVGTENAGIGYRTAVGTARAKIGRWLQELQKHRQARKEGAANFGLITAEMIKFLDGKDVELQASRQAGLLDFIASALPASHTSKPEACQVTIYLLRLLKVVLSLPENRGYFLSQNFLPPIIPILVAAIENYIKIVASLNAPSSTNLTSGRSSTETLDTISEILDGFLWTVAAVIGHEGSDEPQLKMQDGLLELVVAYKVIHRLRDLFALYDRPHVEGSPFPPSILLSIKLLAVLTSKCRNVSPIDWESFTWETKPSNEKVAESVDFRSSPPCIYNGDNETQSLVPNCNLPLPLSDVPEEQPLDQSTIATKNENAMSLDKIPVEVESISPEAKNAGAPDESLSSLLSDSKCSVSPKDEKKSEQKRGLKQPLAFLISSIAETGLVCLPSMLTAVLLQANNRLSSEQTSYVLPSNFEEVATGVLKVLNNLAKIDMTFIQKILARSDLKMEFFHVMSFILSYCTSKWGAATDQNGLLLLESLSLLSYFALFHSENQAVLRWGKDRTILHKVCDLPFAFFSDPELMPVLAGTLVAACFGCEQNKGVVQQELSMDMLLSLLRSCRNSPPVVTPIPVSDNFTTIDSAETNHVENPQRSHRSSLRSSRIQSQKGSALANCRSAKTRHQRDNKMSKLSEEIGMKPNQSAPQSSTSSTLYSRFPESFINKAEQFFSAEIPQF